MTRWPWCVRLSPRDSRPTAHPGGRGPACPGWKTGHHLAGLRLVTAADGVGWVPARRIDTGSMPAVMLAPYDTTELATAVGELLTVLVIDDASGWTWLQTLWAAKAGA